MQNQKFILAKDGHRIPLVVWRNDNHNRKALLICHGMSEHILRYDHMAQFFVNEGFAVYGMDHRGHGRNQQESHIGDLGQSEGWENLVTDALTCVDHIESQGNSQVALFGHSMGSIIALAASLRESSKLNAVILSAFPDHQGFIGKIKLRMAHLVAAFVNKDKPNKFLTDSTFKPFNNKFKPNRTDFDWLNSVDSEVDKYVSDPLCGQQMPPRFFTEFGNGLFDTIDRLKRESVQLPMFSYSGADDPVVGMKAGGVLRAKLLGQHFEPFHSKSYSGCRHEVHNDKDHKEAFKDIHNWLNSVL